MNLFKPEDFGFLDAEGQSLSGRETLPLSRWVRDVIAEEANTILEKYLETLPTIYGTIETNSQRFEDLSHYGFSSVPAPNDEYRAKLICIEPIKKLD